jgi:hypothetical protein
MTSSEQDKYIELIRSLSDQDLGWLRRFVNAEYENRIRFMPGLTEEEQALLASSKLDCIKAIRNRTNLGLADAKELVERWQRGEFRTQSSKT